ncbi:4Fe-4S binding protein [Chimaeribacter californicus]|uniref:4Fe-4S binding protein n=1 Tax=Chimaeribacter californicus TaxID=2060067 RepID=UPI0011AEEE7C
MCAAKKHDESGLDFSQRVSRRGLLRSLFNAARPVSPFPEGPVAVRPPQALQGKGFLARCNGCGACAEACRVGMIRLIQGRAEIVVDTAACDGCLACTLVCQTGALSADTEKNMGLRPAITAGCLGHLDIVCRLCANACSASAIFFNQENVPSIIEAQCWGCGACKLACYHGHINLIPFRHDTHPTRVDK